jgi:hypothetical protein
MSDVFAPKCIGQAADIGGIPLGLGGYEMLFEDAAMDCHVAFPEA